MNTRAIMATVLTDVLRYGRTLDDSLATRLPQNMDNRDRGFVKEVCYGVVRHYAVLEYALARLLDKPLRTQDTDIRALLLCGLYQLHFISTAAHAAVSETVSATRALEKNWAGSLVNAVLRRSQRQDLPRAARDDPDLSLQYLHPQWLIDIIRQDWPEDWRGILEANNTRPPLHLRVNLGRISRPEYRQLLRESAIDNLEIAGLPAALLLPRPVDVAALPGFADGLVSVQDAGAQYAAALLDARSGERVLDGCAAPGGKTAHIGERTPDLAGLVAIDISRERCDLLGSTLQRLSISAEAKCADLCTPDSWWDGEPFDRILLDVPCSATGVIRRHPDIKLLRRQEQLDGLAKKQQKILHSAWSVLKPGGTLLYCTCSILKCENDMVIGNSLAARSDMNPGPETTCAGVETRYGRQLLPGGNDTDGFYYALLRKDTA